MKRTLLEIGKEFVNMTTFAGYFFNLKEVKNHRNFPAYNVYVVMPDVNKPNGRAKCIGSIFAAY